MSPEPTGIRPATLLGRLRTYLLTGLLVLAPSAVTLWVFILLLNRVDKLLPDLARTLHITPVDMQRIPGLGLLATLILLVLVGFLASLLGSGPLARLWDRMLLRIPGVGIVYGSTKSIGEAFLNQNQKEQAFRRVVLVPWPHRGMWRVGFLTGHASPALKAKLGTEVAVVFVPHTPNPASGFVHYVPEQDIIALDWTVEEGFKVVVSGGVVQPGMNGETPALSPEGVRAQQRADDDGMTPAPRA